MKLITVCAQARNVSLDSGRTLHPGEDATVPDSVRHRQLIADRHLSLISPEEE